MKKILLLLSVLAIVSCSDSKRKWPIEEYVFIDKKGIMHTDEGCSAVSKIRGGGQPVKLLKTTLITEKELESICSKCIKREQIDAIRLLIVAKEISEEEEEVEEEYNNHSLGYEIRQWLYVKLGGNTNNMNSWRSFNEQLEDENTRMKIYNEGIRKLLDLPKYNIFCKDIDNYRDDERELMFPIDTVAIIN